MVHLPNDILLCIVDQAELPDIPALSATCKKLRDHCRKKLAEHLEHKKRYRSVAITWKMPESCHPAQVLLLLQQEPWIAQYIEYVVCDVSDPYWPSWDSSPMPQGAIDHYAFNQTTIGTIAKLDADLLTRHLGPIMRGLCLTTVPQGRVSDCLMLLLSLCPNLKRLRIGGAYDCDQWISTPFPKLETVELYHNDTEGAEDLSSLMCWAAFPNVKTLLGDMIEGMDEVSNPTAMLERLELSELHLESSCFKYLLDNITGLRHFACCFSDEYYSDEWDFRELVKVLEDTSPDLETLVVDEPENDSEVLPAKTLTGLENLRSFTGTLAILGISDIHDTGEPIDFSALFPRSLEYLALRSRRALRGELGPMTLRTLRITGLDSLPNLHTIALQLVKVSEESMEQLKAAGITAYDHEPFFPLPHEEVWHHELPLKNMSRETIVATYGSIASRSKA